MPQGHLHWGGAYVRYSIMGTITTPNYISLLIKGISSFIYTQVWNLARYARGKVAELLNLTLLVMEANATKEAVNYVIVYFMLIITQIVLSPATVHYNLMCPCSKMHSSKGKNEMIFWLLPMDEQSKNHISLIKTGLDVTQSHPLRRTRFGQYQASSAALGWPGDGDCHIMHKMQSGGWPYSKVSRDSENLESTVSSSSCSSCSCLSFEDLA